MSSFIEYASWMKAIILICALQFGHTNGLISYMRFMHAAQLLFQELTSVVVLLFLRWRRRECSSFAATSK